MMRIQIWKLLALVGALSFGTNARGVVFNVTTAEEFQAALATASSTDSDDEILLSPGLYEGPFQVALKTTKSLRVSSRSIDNLARLSGDSNIFILSIDGGNHDVDVQLQDLAFDSGYNPSYGGALTFLSQSASSSMEIQSVAFTNNRAKRGGAIYSQAASLIVRDSVFVSNVVTGDIANYSGGAAIYADRGSVLLKSSSFEGNDSSRSDDGGTIHIGVGKSTNLDIENSSFLRNEGVLISSVRSGSLTIDDSIISHRFDRVLLAKDAEKISLHSNEIYCTDCKETLTHIQRFGNQASIEVDLSNNLVRGSGSVSLSFQVEYLDGPKINISGNEFSFVGSVLAADDPTISVFGYESLDFVNNTVLEGSIALEPRFGGDQYTILANNIFSNSNTELTQVSLLAFSRSDALSDNLIQRYTKGWDIEKNNSPSEPIFANLESLDLKLSSSSPGINSGDNSYVRAVDTKDRDGSPRIVDGTVDIGAYERYTEALHPADTNGDSSISRTEFDAYNAAWRTNEPWPNPPAFIEADYVTRAGYLLQKGGAYKNIGVGKPATWVPANGD